MLVVLLLTTLLCLLIKQTNIETNRSQGDNCGGGESIRLPSLSEISADLSDFAAAMEIEVSCSNHDTENKGNRIDLDSIRVKRKTLQNLLEDCQKALELLELTDSSPSGDDNGGEQSESPEDEESDREESSSSDPGDPEADKVCFFIFTFTLSSS